MTIPKTISSRRAALCLLFAALFSAAGGYWLNHQKHGGNLVDFRAIYYGARTVINHHDPYRVEEFLQVYRQEGGSFPAEPSRIRTFFQGVPVCVNLPSTLLVVSPFAFLSWESAQLIWMLLLTGGLVMGAWLMWDLSGTRAPAFALVLACILLANCQNLMQVGNGSGLAVSLCVIGVWCFFRQRHEWVGVICFALGLAIKPQEIAFVWLFFLLAGGTWRRRAWQVSGLALLLLALGVLWVGQVSPHWLQEWRNNIALTSAHGNLNDPGPTSFGSHAAGMVVSLQSVLSFFWDDPHIYNPAAYLLAGGLLLIWCIVALRSRLTEEGGLLAIASVAALSLLPIYHRQYDTKLLLLTIPASAVLWTQRSPIRKQAAVFSAIGIVLTSDIPSAVLIVASKGLDLSQDHLAGRLVSILMNRSPSIGLLLVGSFYLWAYIRHASLAKAAVPATADSTLETSTNLLAESCEFGRVVSHCPQQKAWFLPRRWRRGLNTAYPGTSSS